MSKHERRKKSNATEGPEKGESRAIFTQPALTIIDSTTPEAQPISVYVKSPMTKPMTHPKACQVMEKARWRLLTKSHGRWIFSDGRFNGFLYNGYSSCKRLS